MCRRFSSRLPLVIATAVVFAGATCGQLHAATITFTSQPAWHAALGGGSPVTVLHFDGPTELTGRFADDPLITPSYSSQGVEFLPFLGTAVYPMLSREQGGQIPDPTRDGLLTNSSSTNPTSDLMGRAIRFNFNMVTNAVGVYTNRWPLDNPSGDGGYLQALDASGNTIGQVDLGAGIFGGIITDVPIARVNIVNTWNEDIRFGIWDLQFVATPVPTAVLPSGAQRLALALPAPNPASSSARVCWTLPGDGYARVTVHDVAGRVVRTLHEGACAAGDARASWDCLDAQGRPCAAGLYFVRLAFGGGAQARMLTRRLVVAR